MPNLRGWEWLILLLLVVVLFGAKRLPDAARGVGRSLRIFKAETKGLAEDNSPSGQGADATASAQAQPADSAPAQLEASPASATNSAPPAAAAPAAPADESKRSD